MTALAGFARVVLGGIFLWAALTKVPDMGAFAESVANYRIVPPALVPAAAACLVGVEVVAALALVAGFWTRAAALLLSALLGAFTIGIASALVRGIDLACGCFGGTAPATWGTVVRDVLMLLAALGVAAASPPGARGRTPGSTGTAGSAARG